MSGPKTSAVAVRTVAALASIEACAVKTNSDPCDNLAGFPALAAFGHVPAPLASVIRMDREEVERARPSFERRQWGFDLTRDSSGYVSKETRRLWAQFLAGWAEAAEAEA